jgi:hypothetical protein
LGCERVAELQAVLLENVRRVRCRLPVREQTVPERCDRLMGDRRQLLAEACRDGAGWPRKCLFPASLSSLPKNRPPMATLETAAAAPIQPFDSPAFSSDLSAASAQAAASITGIAMRSRSCRFISAVEADVGVRI